MYTIEQTYTNGSSQYTLNMVTKVSRTIFAWKSKKSLVSDVHSSFSTRYGHHNGRTLNHCT